MPSLAALNPVIDYAAKLSPTVFDSLKLRQLSSAEDKDLLNNKDDSGEVCTM